MSLSIDPGFSKVSPLYVVRGECKCDRCNKWVEETHEIEYVPYGSSEETPSKFANVCETCEEEIRRDKNIVIL